MSNPSLENKKVRILCFGDSNTWGCIPTQGDKDQRYSSNIRWTGVLQNNLGSHYSVIEEGLNSRTTCVDDSEMEGKNGLAALPGILKNHFPIDIFILMLGTNDLKHKYNRTPQQIAEGIDGLIDCVKTQSNLSNCEPTLLVLSPCLPRLEHIYESYQYPELEIKARELAPLIKTVAQNHQIEFFDIAPKIVASTIDGAHLGAEEHTKLAELILPILLRLHTPLL